MRKGPIPGRALPMNSALQRTVIAAALLLAVTGFALVARPGNAATPPPAPGAGGPPALDATAGPPETVTAPHGVGVTAGGAEYARGQVIVTVKGETEPRVIRIPAGSDPERAADRLEARPGIQNAQPNYIARISAWSPNDPGLGLHRRGRAGGWVRKQWNFLPCSTYCHPGSAATGPRSRGGMNVLRGWRHLRRAGRPGAAGVKVAVIDTGIAYRNYGHRFRRNPELSPRRFLPGYDFVRKNRLPLDRNGHGTHIASTIAQTTNNRKGLTGVAYRARLMPVRVMDSTGHGTSANIVSGIRWAARHGARVITMSLNFGCGASEPALASALRFAHRKGAVLIGSSGNRGAVECPSMPATAPQVISVGGTTEAGCVGTYSFRSDEIDLAAPGGGRGYGNCPYSARNRPIMQVAMISGMPDWYGIEPGWVGTSMAAAHVAGAAAAVAASGVLGNRQGPARVKERLVRTARLPAWAAGDPASGYGAGIVDLGRAVNPAAKLNPAG